MLLNRTHRSWLLATIAVVLLSSAAYWWYATSAVNGPRGGTWQGLLFGIAGSICMIIAGLLPARKKVPGARVGTAKGWLRGHLWIGLWSVPLILFHAGFRLGGSLEQVLMAVFGIVIFSGIFGVILQQYLPRYMTAAVPAQAITEQIPIACGRLRKLTEEAVLAACGPEALAEAMKAEEKRSGPTVTLSSIASLQTSSKTGKAKSSLTNATISSSVLMDFVVSPLDENYSPEGELAKFFCEDVLSFLSPSATREHPLASPTLALARISRLEGSVPTRLRPAVEEIRVACDERRQLMSQQRIHNWLHGWLFPHIILSMVLLILAVAHTVMSLFY
ncbi:hypothetical protein [Planctomyces sp. SH-PL14]|jgi:hypothetical protein|uniref:hypothetical protein n=1 Tax=Planctomyces sp. SH-PL14 TaxID=1632864 RepID=UPI00078D7A1F|nr:hypothetical protein [Planctomyces sp. SH-PL14]AMV21061.1 hypothetical protein VT03_24370 [Planctomyces sp. SH-PL14]